MCMCMRMCVLQRVMHGGVRAHLEGGDEACERERGADGGPDAGAEDEGGAHEGVGAHVLVQGHGGEGRAPQRLRGVDDLFGGGKRGGGWWVVGVGGDEQEKKRRDETRRWL